MSPLGQTRPGAVAVLLAAPALGVLSGDPRTAFALLTTALDAPPAGDPTAPLLAAVALTAWACAGWLLLVVALVGLGRLNGRLGRAAHLLGSWVAPVSVRAVAGLAVGMTVTGTVLAGPALATEPTPAPTAHSAPAATASEAARPSLDWPTTTAQASATATPAAATSATPATPATPAATAAPAASHAPGPSASGSEVPRRTVTPTTQRDAVPAPGAPAASAVVVQAGDSLWAIAARDLGASATPARIARAWPQWWQANRAVLGTDPDLIHPGTSLTDPTR